MPTTYAIPDGRVAMAATLYAGSSSAQSIVNTVNGVSFQPDLVWGKNRSNVNSHRLTDVNRGVGRVLFSNDTAGDTTGDGQLSSFNSNGWTFTSGAGAGLNESGNNYVAWNWKAGGAAVTNTAGTRTSQVSANTAAGFSVVTYTGTGAAATVGHGLGVAPNMIIFKGRNYAIDWAVYHASIGAGSKVYLNLTNASAADTTYMNNTAPTSSVFSIAASSWTNNSSAATYVAYCFAAVPGYSAFGTWQNNNSTDGTFIYTGFRPRFILLKNYDNVERWFTWDSTRQTYNMPPPSNNWLVPNDSAAEGANGAQTAEIDGLSNGFKIRTTNPASGEISFGTRNYIYAAFAETPFKYANAR